MTESKVDVLLLLDDVATWKGEFMGDFFSASEVRLARAAVAELIEAAKEFDVLPLTGNFELDAHEYGPQSVKKAMRLRAALAASTPAKEEGR
jgi:hypothetical protein